MAKSLCMKQFFTDYHFCSQYIEWEIANERKYFENDTKINKKENILKTNKNQKKNKKWEYILGTFSLVIPGFGEERGAILLTLITLNWWLLLSISDIWHLWHFAFCDFDLKFGSGVIENPLEVFRVFKHSINSSTNDPLHIKCKCHFWSAILNFVILTSNMDSATSKIPKKHFNF